MSKKSLHTNGVVKSARCFHKRIYSPDSSSHFLSTSASKQIGLIFLIYDSCRYFFFCIIQDKWSNFEIIFLPQLAEWKSFVLKPTYFWLLNVLPKSNFLTIDSFCQIVLLGVYSLFKKIRCSFSYGEPKLDIDVPIPFLEVMFPQSVTILLSCSIKAYWRRPFGSL